jgi:hypothetical protein
MVDWDRVQELRSKGWDWSDIAKDPKVDFHPDSRAGSPARALRALYHRTGRRAQHAAVQAAPPKRLRKGEAERRWTLTRIGYLGVPVVALWFVLAYAAPSPVGLVVPAIPYLGLVLAGFAFVLIYALWRKTEGPRWSTVYRQTVVGGVVLGLVVGGGIGLAGALIFGCPYLPPPSTLNAYGGSGWATGALSPWQTNGAPVVFYYGSTWCPYCSASSWAIYKALTEYATVGGVYTWHSSLSDVYPGTPEMVLAGATLAPRNGHGPAVDFQVAEDTSNVEGTLPGTASCYQQAYVTAYASGIPFLSINGQAVHDGSLVDPGGLTPWNYANGTSGQAYVQNSVVNENNVPWTYVQTQAWWIMAYIAKYLGYNANTVSTLGGTSYYDWSAATLSGVTSDLSSIT